MVHTRNGADTEPSPPPGDKKALTAEKLRLREARQQLTFTKKPLSTLYYLSRETGVLLMHALAVLQRRAVEVVAGAAAVGAAAYFVYHSTNPAVLAAVDKGYEALFWIVLGILSSVGLGTGLHTFILYLGPYIAHMTMHAYTCGTTDLPDPFHSTVPSSWGSAVCPAVPEGGHGPITILKVIRAVQFPALMWGAGTAIGELPPYFVARAASESHDIVDDEDLEDLHATMKAADDSLVGRAKHMMHTFVQKAGFFGILLCASIPNPLFDLAGLTCGHFQIPFWTFFGATLLGKAVFKAHIQAVSLVVIMSEPVFNAMLDAIDEVPYAGDAIAAALKGARESAQAKFASDEPHEEPETNYLSLLLAVLVIGMVLFFVTSILEQLAQRNKKREDLKRLAKLK